MKIVSDAMCGVAGIHDRAGNIAPDMLTARTAAMGEALRHRGPDDDDIWTDAEVGIGFAHRRLAVIAPTLEGHQPTVSRSGRFVLTYNGEIYNYRELADRLAAGGHPVETNSDTVVLVEAIDRWGVRGACERAVGMFAFAAFDRETRTLSLARDRLGIKPLYWARQGERFVFGSELKAIRASRTIELNRDPDALCDYMRYAYVPAPATIYREARKLPPGSIMTIGARGEPVIDFYWNLTEIARAGQNDPVVSDDADIADEAERLLRQAVSDRLVSDVPLGAWLSGGLDSSSVVALMQEISPRPVRTFSIGFPVSGYDETDDAYAIAEHLGADHQRLDVTPQQALDAIGDLPNFYDEPFADSSQIPTFVLSRLTRGHVTVALSGDGGDEVFGGYNRYAALPRIRRHVGNWPRAACLGMAGAIRLLSPNVWDVLGRAIPRFGDKMWKVAAAIEAPDLDAAYLGAISQWQTPHALVPRATGGMPQSFLDARLADPVAQMQLADFRGYLPDDILAKVDRASMAHALEVRVPLLDHRLVEFAWRLPRTSLIDGSLTKKPLRAILARHMPRKLFERPKSGFDIPIAAWLRGPLRDWTEDLLSESALRRSDVLSPEPIRHAWAAHLSGRRNLSEALWTVLMFQLWDRTWSV